MSDNQHLMQLAFGRILRLCSRPAQQGDVADYERCKKIFMEAAEEEGITAKPDDIGTHVPGWNFGNRVLD